MDVRSGDQGSKRYSVDTDRNRELMLRGIFACGTALEYRQLLSDDQERDLTHLMRILTNIYSVNTGSLPIDAMVLDIGTPMTFSLADLSELRGLYEYRYHQIKDQALRSISFVAMMLISILIDHWRRILNAPDALTGSGDVIVEPIRDAPDR